MTETLPTGATPRRRSPLRATWLDMVRSLVVIVAIVVGLVLLVPRPSRVDQPAVDVGSAAAGAERTLGGTVLVPRVPADWVPTEATVQTGQDGVRAWAISYRTPSGYAGLRQAPQPTKRWESAIVGQGEEGATQQVGGLSWLRRDRADRGATHLVHRSDEGTVIVSSLGSEQDALRLAEAAATAAGAP